MTQPTPPAAPEPVPPSVHGGPAAHIEQWLAQHLAPGLEDIRHALEAADAKGEKALAAVSRAMPAIERTASVLAKAIAAADPSAAPAIAALLPEAERAAAEIAQIAEAILAAGGGAGA